MWHIVGDSSGGQLWGTWSTFRESSLVVRIRLDWQWRRLHTRFVFWDIEWFGGCYLNSGYGRDAFNGKYLYVIRKKMSIYKIMNKQWHLKDICLLMLDYAVFLCKLWINGDSFSIYLLLCLIWFNSSKDVGWHSRGSLSPFSASDNRTTPTFIDNEGNMQRASRGAP